ALRPSFGLVLCSCFFVVCFADESREPNHEITTNQESRKDTKVQLMSQVCYYPCKAGLNSNHRYASKAKSSPNPPRLLGKYVLMFQSIRNYHLGMNEL